MGSRQWAPLLANRGLVFKPKAFAGRRRGLARDQASMSELRTGPQADGRAPEGEQAYRVAPDLDGWPHRNQRRHGQARRKFIERSGRFPRKHHQALSAKNEMRQMNANDGLRVLVARRGEKFIWELHRAGITRPVKFSVPIFLSEESANASGAMARTAHLARLARRSPETDVASRAPRQTRRTTTGGRGKGS